jgi:hypothetical protein
MQENSFKFFDKISNDICTHFNGDCSRITSFTSTLYHTVLRMAAKNDRQFYLSLMLITMEKALEIYSENEFCEKENEK